MASLDFKSFRVLDSLLDFGAKLAAPNKSPKAFSLGLDGMPAHEHSTTHELHVYMYVCLHMNTAQHRSCMYTCMSAHEHSTTDIIM